MIQKTRDSFSVRVLSGEVVFRLRRTHAHSVVVTAGSAQIATTGAVYCVRVTPDRTSVTVAEGAVQLSALEPPDESRPEASVRTESPVVDHMPLRPGDQAEVIRIGTNVVLRLKALTRSQVEDALSWERSLMDVDDAAWQQSHRQPMLTFLLTGERE